MKKEPQKRGSKSKGSSFERDTSRALSLWWTDEERDDVFWRNRTRVTSKTPNAERQLGDLTCVHTVGLPFIEVFNVELKTGYSKTKKGKKHKVIPWDLLDLIDGKGRIFLEFWEQADTDAVLSNRIPMLIFKRDYHTPVVAVRRSDMLLLEGLNGIIGAFHLSVHTVEWGPIDLYPFDKFFKWLRPDTIKAYSVTRALPYKLVEKRPQKKIIRRRKNDSAD